jgi:hypothetical protein
MSLQEAIDLIGEIRKKLEVPEDFYVNSGSLGGCCSETEVSEQLY